MTAPTTPPEKTTEGSTTIPVKAEERRLRFLDPFEDLRDEMSRLWGRRPLVGRAAFRSLAPLAEGMWAPRMDVFEKNSNLMIKAELPGVEKENIRVEMVEGDLIVHGERKSESEVKDGDYYRLERAYGSFRRRLPIPFEVKPEQVKANYKDGVLEIQIPRPAQAVREPKAIAIS